MHKLTDDMVVSYALLLFIVHITKALSASSSLSQRMFADPGVDPVLLATWHNITCVGQSYDLKLPLQPGWNPNNVSVQHLCAKTKYGGGPAEQNIGGWCDHGEVVFDYQDSAHVNRQLSIPRVQLGCRYRCFCNHNVPEEQLSMQPKAREGQVSLGVRSKESSQTNEIRLDIIDDFNIAPRVKRGRRGSVMVPSVRLSHVMENDVYEDLFSARYQYVSQDPGNSIHCAGPLPNFILPEPYATTDFENLQEMCAVQLDGGLFGANAGGFCYRSDAVGKSGRTVWFSDEMTPRLEWTWAGGNFFAAASIRMHCARYCNCVSSNGSATNDTYHLDGLWNFVGSAGLALRSSGQVDLVSANNAPSMTILPAQNGPGSASGTCGADGKQFCPQAWPTSLLGPVPGAPPNATDIIRPRPNPGSHSDLTTCGNTCQGPQDCGGGDAEKACACAIPSAKDAQALGLDPVFPVAVCLVLMHSNFGGTGGLIGRGIESRPCLCNATFIHEECCQSKDGMVWLS